MQVFVTGGTGFLGNHVIRALVRHGLAVKALIRPTSHWENLADLPVKPVLGDLEYPTSLLEGCRDADLVIHVAADYRLWVPDPHRMEQVNIRGTENLLEAAVSAGVERIVYTSSAVTVACRNGHIGTEEDFVQPDDCLSTYQRTKVQAEQAVRRWIDQGAPVVIVNPTTIIGPMDWRPTPAGRLIIDYLCGRLPAYLDARLNWIDVRDVAEGHWLAATKGRVGERYVLGHENRSLTQLLALLAEITGKPAPRMRIPYPVAYAAGWAGEQWSLLSGKEPRATREGVRMARRPMQYHSRKALQELGLPQTPLRFAVADAVRWFREKGYAHS